MRPKTCKKHETFQPDHEVYKLSDLKNVIPICLHGDKGRGYSRTPTFCFSIEGVFGLPSEIRSAATRAAQQIRRIRGTPHLELWSFAFDGESCPEAPEAGGCSPGNAAQRSGAMSSRPILNPEPYRTLNPTTLEP